MILLILPLQIYFDYHLLALVEYITRYYKFNLY